MSVQHPPQDPVVGPVPGRHLRTVAGVATEAAPAGPADRTADRLERVLVMGALTGGWALALSNPRFGAVLPGVALMLLAAAVHPALSLPRLLGRVARVGLGVGLPPPRLRASDPAPQRLGRGLTGALLVVAALCATVSPVAAWALGWVVIALALVEFTVDTPIGVMVHTRVRRRDHLRI